MGDKGLLRRRAREGRPRGMGIPEVTYTGIMIGSSEGDDGESLSYERCQTDKPEL